MCQREQAAVYTIQTMFKRVQLESKRREVADKKAKGSKKGGKKKK